MRPTSRRLPHVAVPLLLLLAPAPAGAQGPSLRIMAQAIPSATEMDPIPGGGSLGEAHLVQPIVMLQAAALGGRLRGTGTFDFEGLTMPDGVLTPGARDSTTGATRTPTCTSCCCPRWMCWDGWMEVGVCRSPRGRGSRPSDRMIR